MPLHYENEPDYESKEEEEQDIRDANQSKLQTMKKQNIMSFDDFLEKEELAGGIHSKNSK